MNIRVSPLLLTLGALVTSQALAQQAQPLIEISEAAEVPPAWTGTGELGIAMIRGNSRSENANARLNVAYEDSRQRHLFTGELIRAKSEVSDTLGTRYETTASRYVLGASTAIKLDERRYWVTVLRYENDDFASYSEQATLAIGYGHYFIRNDATTLLTEIGPGLRYAKEVDTGDSHNGAVLRGLVDFSHQLTDTTQLVNTLLVEAGSDNTYVQNDLGLAVRISEKLALKASWQLRHNTEDVGNSHNTDTLTTVNLVYNFR